ncbi:Asp-tRNA(Asn)/Glu-tRNA(Gln) amidotransferase subunit GatC [Prochlorococcus sp. MIT 1341]|uniref:Asp-tRNA(Asn)/Glu-tRNA(Gln) amidotransferase subunit GatC n=1 Tax=Prochlorococcus sp. MIT 1341 TaxID=3096221 RepID=UPI002A74F2B6|nr:Asp-tRNA(Asn)/Glu-tRNA(Gln) amidotransferase subunit GatC [Prochlorococcus sp. MIT 1341]
MSNITKEDVKKVAILARLALKEEEISSYTEQLEKILGYVAQLQQIDTQDVPATTRAVEVTNVTRDDTSKITNIRDKLLDLGPQREGEFFRVPKILSD